MADVHIFVYMSTRLTEGFRTAAKTATATLGDVARGTGRHYRTLMSYQRGERRVTTAAAAALVRYLRNRARQLDKAADDLEAAKREEGDNE